MSRSSVTGKEFVIRYVFNDVSNMNENDMRISTVEEYFNVPWIFQIQRNNGNLGIYLRCRKLKGQEMWSMFTELELKLISVYSDTRDQKCKTDMCFGHDSGKFYSSYGWSEFISWNELETSFMDAGSITVEARVIINKSIGFYTPKLMNFDEKKKEYSDIVVLVDGQRFYLLKKFLAFHSTFFESLFLGGFYEAKLTEVPLYDIDVDDFQKFLEVLYGFPVINDNTVEGILLLADMYQTPLVSELCEDFLIQTTGKTYKKKLQMAIKFNLENLKQFCISMIKSPFDLRSMIPSDISSIDHSTLAALFTKSLTLMK
ncbi:BTB domain-containing protein [Caenorhabditis elegans]|uniref:BTB domain-containing protein n=1 Tax=Caenorhabditis elegans TaxID=6239 RepID=Q8MXH8_CAEEL|nr:BTB domain-containing protein [Caenorhabditis elegans]CCD69486.1 BTB domain-containing protein [Caenorhabditis elegans]|eukprot:NP_494512.2 BTB and MATH domain containing [Caenorhabditis elegans]